MAVVLILTASPGGAAEVLPGLSLLPHDVRVAAPEPSALLDAPAVDAVLIDARRDLAGARGLARLLRTTGLSAPMLAVVTEGGLVAVATDWGLSDVVLDAASPAEVDARLRLAAGRAAAPARGAAANEGAVSVGELVIDEVTYSARLRGRALELTFKEFELLKFLAQHPGRVFTRAQLLQEVWGYDYYGGTRTVDVHVRRLRAKLGAEHEQLIGTVRHVGYKFVAPPAGSSSHAGVSNASADGSGANAGMGMLPHGGRPMQSSVVLPV
jgi:DNA-binding response OmpR family regulator